MAAGDVAESLNWQAVPTDCVRNCGHRKMYRILWARCRMKICSAPFENGFDERLDYQTLSEVERTAQKYVAGTMEGEAGFADPAVYAGR